MEEQNVSDIATKEDLIRLAGPFAELMNQMQREDGAKIGDVLSAALYTIGCALAQVGSHINVSDSVEEVLPALVGGYNEAFKDVKKRMM